MFVFNMRKIKKPFILGALILMLGISGGCLVQKFFALSEHPVIKLQEQPMDIQEIPTIAHTQELKAPGEELVLAYQMERKRFLSKNVEVLQSLIQDEKQSKEIREQASVRMLALIEKNTKEEKIEFLLQAAGIKNCAVMLEGDKVNVILSEAVAAEQIENLKKIVHVATANPVENIQLIAP